MTRGGRSHALVALAAIAVAAMFAFGLVAVGGGLPSTSDAYDVHVVLPTAGSLTGGARVTVAGAKVGSVRKVERAGMGAVATVRINATAVRPLPAGSEATLRMRTPVGENYISIVPGRSRATIPNGGTLARADDEYVEVDELLSTLQGRTRERTRQLLASSGEALDARGKDLNDLLDGTAGVLDSGSELTAVLAKDRTSLAQVVHQLGSLAEHIAERGEAIQGLARYGNRTLAAVAGRQRAVGELLDELPATLRSVRRTTGQVESVSAKVAPRVNQIAAAVREVRPAVRRLRPTATAARALVQELGVTAPGLRTTIGALQALTKPAVQDLPRLTKALCAVNPVLRYARPYTPDIVATVTGLGSASNAYDAIGHTVRLTPVLNDRALAGAPDAVLDAADELLHSGLLGKTTPLTWDPYPAPGMAGKSSAAGKPSIQNPEQLAASGWKFPRLNADC